MVVVLKFVSCGFPSRCDISPGRYNSLSVSDTNEKQLVGMIHIVKIPIKIRVPYNKSFVYLVEVFVWGGGFFSFYKTIISILIKFLL